MKQNPYSLVFGKKPNQVISRVVQTDEVIRTFTDEPSTQQIYMITGVRGTGKTVFMTEIANRLQSETGWITVELNPEGDLLQNLVSKLCSQDRLAKLFQHARINLSFFGIGLEVKGVAPVTDIWSDRL